MKTLGISSGKEITLRPADWKVKTIEGNACGGGAKLYLGSEAAMGLARQPCRIVYGI